MATSQLCSVKTSLKSRILQRRQESGLGDIQVDFSPKPEQPLTAEEIEKDRKRKESNRRSAMKSRNKIKEQDEKNTKLLKRETTRNKILLNRLSTLKNLRDTAMIKMKSLGVPDSTIMAGLAPTRLEWTELLQNQASKSTNATAQPQTRSSIPSRITSSTCSVDSDTYSSPSDSTNSSITSSPMHEFASSNFGQAPVYSYTSKQVLAQNSMALEYVTAPTMLSSSVEQVDNVQEASEVLVMEEDSLLKLDFELDPVSPATVSSIVDEGRQDCLFEDGTVESLGLGCIGGSGDFVNATQHNRLPGFEIRQALMCM